MSKLRVKSLQEQEGEEGITNYVWGSPTCHTQGTCSNDNRLCLVHQYGRHFVLCRCVRKHTHRGYTADPAPNDWQEANPIWSWAGDLQIPSNTSCRGINSLSLITKSTSPDSSTYHLTTKSTWSPQLDAINSSLWVSHSSCYCLGSHSEVLWRNALPSWSRPSAIFSPIQGWASHSLYTGHWTLEAALRSCPFHCLHPPLLLFPFPSIPRVEISLMTPLCPSEPQPCQLPSSVSFRTR